MCAPRPSAHPSLCVCACVWVRAAVLSTQALLYAVGLGAGSLPVAAALSWALRDGLGQAGGVLYAALAGPRFDADPKRHRARAALALQAATALELLTPWAPPGAWLPLAAAANVGKNIAWLASAGTRASLHQALVRQGNLGDVTAKAGAQATAAGLVGTAVGIAVAAGSAAAAGWVGGWEGVEAAAAGAAAAYVPFAAVSLYALRQSNRVVPVPTLNAERLELLLAIYWTRRLARARLPSLAAWVSMSHDDDERGENDQALCVPTPAEVAAQERLLVWRRVPQRVEVGPPLRSHADDPNGNTSAARSLLTSPTWGLVCAPPRYAEHTKALCMSRSVCMYAFVCRCVCVSVLVCVSDCLYAYVCASVSLCHCLDG
jgi:hypothetical protein